MVKPSRCRLIKLEITGASRYLNHGRIELNDMIADRALCPVGDCAERRWRAASRARRYFPNCEASGTRAPERAPARRY
jgi:hypothetical protein